MFQYHQFLWIALLVFSVGSVKAEAPFSFHDEITLEGMQRAVRSIAPLRASRDDVRQIFVEQAGADLLIHPASSNTEKYIYDINICRLYVWRWNISVDYSRRGTVQQVFVNGESVHRRGEDSRTLPRRSSGGNNSMMAVRPRPEADQGERGLMFIARDTDGNMETWHDRAVIFGAGPSRLHPENMGQMHTYQVELWRSIFDPDNVSEIADYRGACPEPTPQQEE